MIKVELLNNNNIVTLLSENKIPIKSSGGLFHHSSVELLGCAIGACLGKTVVKFCSEKSLDISNISLTLNIESNIVLIYITITKQVDIVKLIADLRSCDMVKLLNNSLRFEFNTTETLISNHVSKKRCCGE